MSCQICGRNSCASWMHSATEVQEFESVSELDDNQLRSELMAARREIADLKTEIEELREAKP